MRVLQVHNFYRSSAPSGEDAVVRDERKLLAEFGATVQTFEKHNDDIPPTALGAMSSAASNIWSWRSQRELSAAIRQFRPDIVHCHNTFPQISQSGYRAAAMQGVPMVQTLHNFRLFCANGLMQRDSKPCELCVGRAPLPALRHRCYRDSLAASAAMAVAIGANRLWQCHLRFVNRFVALTDFAAQKFVAAGIPADRLCVRPNALCSDPGSGDGAGGFALYVGRLTAEKGVATLIDAWRQLPELPLKIVGDGELGESLRARAAGLPVEFLGQLPSARVLELMKSAGLLVVPSECYEGYPRVIAEAFATGTPVVASKLGGPGELIVDKVNGMTFAARDSAALARAVRQLHSDAALQAAIRRSNRERFLRDLTPHAAFNSLIRIYQEAGADTGWVGSGLQRRPSPS